MVPEVSVVFDLSPRCRRSQASGGVAAAGAVKQEIGNAAVRAASGERAARARLPITVIDRQSLGEALAWWRKSYAT